MAYTATTPVADPARAGQHDFALALAKVAGHFQLGAVLQWGPIQGGTVNKLFRLQTTRGSWVARQSGALGADGLCTELALLTGLAQRGVPVASPVGAPMWCAQADQRGAWWSVFVAQPGGHLATNELTPKHLYRLGGLLAQLHRSAQHLPVRAPSHRYSLAELARRLRQIAVAAVSDEVLAAALPLLQQQLQTLAAQAELPMVTIIHSDLFRDNVIVSDAAMVLIDFEQACAGHPAYDLAVVMWDWCWRGGRFDDALLAALGAGYRAHVDGTSRHHQDRLATWAGSVVMPLHEELLYALRYAAVRFCITRITDVYLAGDRRPEKDFRDFLARLAYAQLAGCELQLQQLTNSML